MKARLCLKTTKHFIGCFSFADKRNEVEVSGKKYREEETCQKDPVLTFNKCRLLSLQKLS